MARKAANNPRQIRSKSCGCKPCTEKFRPGEKPTRRDCTGAWQARYRDPSGRQRSKNYPTKTEASAFLDRTRDDVRTGGYVSPAKAGTVAEFHARWWPSQRGGETTKQRIESAWTNHVEPHFGDWPLNTIGYLDVEAWIAGLTKTTGVPTITKAFRLLDGLMTAAVRERRIKHNPCDGVRLPRQRTKHPDDLLPPTYDQLAAVREHIPDHYYPLLIVAEETGLRWGELAGLRRQHVDFKARRIQVREVIIEVHGTPKRKPYPKSAAGSRSVPLTDRAVQVLRQHLKRCPAAAGRTTPRDGMHAEELVFRGPKAGVKAKNGRTFEGVLKRNNFRRLWVSAIKEAGIAREVTDPVTKRTEMWPHVHDIRHAFASRMHAAGVPEADAQKILGHERGGKITWLYTHAGSEAVDSVRAALDVGGPRLVSVS